MTETLAKLKGGDRRSLGNSEEVVREVLDNPALFEDLMAGLFESEAVVRMRSADVMEKVTQVSPNLAEPWKHALLEVAAASRDKEVRWHFTQMLPRLGLTRLETDQAVCSTFEMTAAS